MLVQCTLSHTFSKSQRGMSDLLNRAAKEAREGNLDIKRQVRHIGNHFLNSVEVGAQEAAYLVLQMPLTKASRDVAFINTSPIDERVILVKPETELQKLSDNSTDIECSNIFRRYSKRPKQLENWCLADYVSQLDVFFPKENTNEVQTESETNDDEIHDAEDVESESDTDVEFKEDSTLVVLKNGFKIKQRKTPRVIRYVRFNLKTDPENYYRENLCCFLHGDVNLLTCFLDLTVMNGHLTTKNFLLLTRFKSTNTMLTFLIRQHIWHKRT